MNEKNEMRLKCGCTISTGLLQLKSSVREERMSAKAKLLTIIEKHLETCDKGKTIGCACGLDGRRGCCCL